MNCGSLKNSWQWSVLSFISSTFACSPASFTSRINLAGSPDRPSGLQIGAEKAFVLLRAAFLGSRPAIGGSQGFALHSEVSRYAALERC